VVVDQLWSDEDEVTIVGPGENVKIKLKGVEEEDISSGFVLCDPTNTCKTGRIFDAQVCYPSFIYISYFFNSFDLSNLPLLLFRSSFWSTRASFARAIQLSVTSIR
jgi:hypothetical protein